MTRSLPPNPSLRYLKEEAKDLLKAQRSRDVGACAVLRRLRRFHGAADQDILSADVALHEAQFALAMEYGFASWADLTHHVKSLPEAVVFEDSRARGLRLKADRLRGDTFSLTVASALNLLGRSAEYEQVSALSTNPFAPDIRPEEPTRGHWQLQGRERCLDLIAAAMGVEFRPFPDYHELAEIPPMPKDAGEAEVWLREYYAKPAASYLSHALQAGEVVLSCGEWAGAPGLLWCDWGLVVQAREDGTILGAGPNGRSDNLITHIRDGWILRAGGSTPAPEQEIRRRLLQRIVQRIRGEGPAFGPGPRQVVFGVKAMDAWIAAMKEVPFDREQWQGKDHSAAHAHETALPVIEGSRAAGACLRAWSQTVPVQAAAGLLEATRQYDRIVELLAPALADSGPKSYASIMGDATGQQSHAQEALQPVRECLAAAADGIEQALAAS